MHVRCTILLTLLLSNLIALGHHKIIFQISPPRSLSTVFLRMWQERGDFVVMNEPSQYPSNFNNPEWYQVTASYWREGLSGTYADTYQAILRRAEKTPVFVKEISFSALQFLLSCPEIVRNPDIQFIFLMRHPHDVIISWYKVQGCIVDDFVNLIGFKAMYDIWQLVNRENPNKALVISAEELSNNPHDVVSRMCSSLDISFDERILSWESLGDSFDGKDWHDQKKPEFVHMWHKHAILSVNFRPLVRYNTDERGKPTFVEITDEEDRAGCFAAYDENVAFYNKQLHEMKSTEKAVFCGELFNNR